MKRDYEKIAERHAAVHGWKIVPLAGCYDGQQYEVNDSQDKKLTCGYVGKARAYVAACEALGLTPYSRRKTPKPSPE